MLSILFSSGKIFDLIKHELIIFYKEVFILELYKFPTVQMFIIQL